MQKKIYLVLFVALVVGMLGYFLLLHNPQQTDKDDLHSPAADTHESTGDDEGQTKSEDKPKPSKKVVKEAQEIMNLKAVPTAHTPNAAVEKYPLNRWLETKEAYGWMAEIVVGVILLNLFPQYKIIVGGLLVVVLLFA